MRVISLIWNQFLWISFRHFSSDNGIPGFQDNVENEINIHLVKHTRLLFTRTERKYFLMLPRNLRRYNRNLQRHLKVSFKFYRT